MNRPKNTSFADRLSAAADAKKAQLERAARARSEAESPAAIERRMARDAVRVARDARIAERTTPRPLHGGFFQIPTFQHPASLTASIVRNSGRFAHRSIAARAPRQGSGECDDESS